MTDLTELKAQVECADIQYGGSPFTITSVEVREGPTPSLWIEGYVMLWGDKDEWTFEMYWSEEQDQLVPVHSFHDVAIRLPTYYQSLEIKGSEDLANTAISETNKLYANLGLKKQLVLRSWSGEEEGSCGDSDELWESSSHDC